MALRQAQGSLLSYPAPPGDKRVWIGDVAGPVSYVQVAVATPPTGGIKINASDIGLVAIEWAQVMGSDDGQFDGVCFPAVVGVGREWSAIIIEAVVAATGAQVAGAVNLSARSFRLFVMGY